MKPHLFAAVALAALGGLANAQSRGSETSNDRAPLDPFTTPAVPGDPATRLPPNVPATPSPPSTPVDVPPVGTGAAKTEASCNALADASARKDCLMHASADAGPKGAGRPQGADTPASAGSGPGAAEHGMAEGGGGSSKGTPAPTDSGAKPAKGE